MKTALCISGQTRTLDKSFPFLKDKILDRFNPDVFVSTWETGNSVAGVYKTYFGDKLKLLESHYWDDKGNEIFNSGPANNSNPMFYKIWRADSLRREYQTLKSFKYDLVIRTRPDLSYAGDIKEDDIDMVIDDNNMVYVGNDCPGKDWIRDLFAFGSGPAMAAYSSVWWLLDEIKKSGVKTNELMLLEGLRRMGVQIKISDFQYDIIR